FDVDVYFRFVERAAKAGITVPIVPGILPVTNFAQVKKFAATCGAAVPGWMAGLFEGLDNDPDTRRLVAASIAAEQCRRLQAEGVCEFHFYTLNRADLLVAICHMIGVRACETPHPNPPPLRGREGRGVQRRRVRQARTVTCHTFSTISPTGSCCATAPWARRCRRA